jgi:hypothetical protein
MIGYDNEDQAHHSQKEARRSYKFRFPVVFHGHDRVEASRWHERENDHFIPIERRKMKEIEKNNIHEWIENELEDCVYEKRLAVFLHRFQIHLKSQSCSENG